MRERPTQARELAEVSLESPESKLTYRLPEPDLQGRTALALTPLGNRSASASSGP